MNNKHILIIEDDESISSLEKDYLETKDFKVTIIENGVDGLSFALSNNVDLIVLDIMLPEIDGFSILKKIRETKNIPVLLVSAKSMEIDKVKGLGFGADDYITKPFNFNEFVARVEAHLSRYDKLTTSLSNSVNEEQLSFDGLVIEPDTRRVYVNNIEVGLVNKEFEVLYLLAKNPNIVFSKDKIMDTVWGYDSFGDTNTVTVHINRIREKIEINSKNYIATVRGAGYCFRD